MWKWSDSLNSLRVGDFGRPRPLFVSALPRVYCRGSSRLLKGTTIEQADCVTLSTELDGDAEMAFCSAFGCSKYDKHRKDGASFHWFPRIQNEEFRRRLLHCAKYSDTIQRDLQEIPGLRPISLTGRG